MQFTIELVVFGGFGDLALFGILRVLLRFYLLWWFSGNRCLFVLCFLVDLLLCCLLRALCVLCELQV